MKNIITIFLLLFIPISLFSIDNVYQLVNVYEKADLNYDFLNSIDSQKIPYPKNSSFMIGDIPIKRGKYKVFKFIAVRDANYSYEPTNPIMHAILIIKTDSKQRILDAYHYILEWSDLPSYCLAKNETRGLILTRYLSLSKFHFKTLQGERISVKGILDDYYQNKHLFKEISK